VAKSFGEKTCGDDQTVCLVSAEMPTQAKKTLWSGFQALCSVLGAMLTFGVGMFPREKRRMAAQTSPWHPLHLS